MKVSSVYLRAGGRVKESWNQLDWKRSSSPAFAPGLLAPPLNRITEGLVYTVCEHFQGW